MTTTSHANYFGGEAGGVSGSYGLTVDGSGSLHWDHSWLANQLPDSAKGPAGKAINAALNGDWNGTVNNTLDEAALVLAAYGTPGLIAAGLVELVKVWIDMGQVATIDWSWPRQFGGFDPGPPFSFRQYANGVLLGTWNTIVQKHTPGTLDVYEAALASALAAAAEQWNNTHSSDAKETVSYPDVRWTGCGWGMPNHEPIAVAAGYLAHISGAPCDRPWSMVVNAGAYHKPQSLLNLLSFGAPAPVAPIRLSFGAPAPVAPIRLSFGAPAPVAPAPKPISPLLIAGGAVLAIALLKPALLKGILR